MYYIFVDCDGVINKEASWKTSPFFVDENCIQALAELVHKLHTKIVLTSTWRAGFDPYGTNHSPQIQHLIDIFHIYDIEIDDITPVTGGKTRSEEIAFYVKRHAIEDYVILDDDASLFSNDNRLYLVNPKIGLTEKDVKKILKKYKKRKLTEKSGNSDVNRKSSKS